MPEIHMNLTSCLTKGQREPPGGKAFLPFVKWLHFVIGPCVLVCQFIEISNQMEVNGEVANFG